MNALTHILARSGLLTRDLDYHLIRASMVLIFLAFGYQRHCHINRFYCSLLAPPLDSDSINSMA
jgi:hypothetical protein